MFKNVASQIWVVYAYQDDGGTNPGEPVTGDAANITANLRLDGGAANAVDDTNPAELEDGFYFFTITQAESNADNIVIAPVSATANVNVVGAPAVVYTRDWGVGDISAILVDTSTTLDTRLDDIAGATFVTGTDSLEAIRNRGDAAWTGSAVTSDSGTAQAGAASNITLAATAPAVDNVLEGHLVFISSGTGAGQSKAIAENGYDGTSKVATIIGSWEVNPDATSVYAVYPDAITEVTAAPTAAVVADAVWDENTTGHTNAGSFGEQLKNDVDAILVDTGSTLQTVIDTINTNVAAVLVDTAEIGAAGVGLTALATQASLDALDVVADAILVDTETTIPALLGSPAADLAADIAAIKAETANILTDTAEIATVDTVVDAIKVQTDKLTFTIAGIVDANIQRINDVAIVGDGSGTPYNV
jgi:hypothetical protein